MELLSRKELEPQPPPHGLRLSNPIPLGDTKTVRGEGAAGRPQLWGREQKKGGSPAGFSSGNPGLPEVGEGSEAWGHGRRERGPGPA